MDKPSSAQLRRFERMLLDPAPQAITMLNAEEHRASLLERKVARLQLALCALAACERDRVLRIPLDVLVELPAEIEWEIIEDRDGITVRPYQEALVIAP